ncbi:hypothetical protein [Alcaligenes sp. SDU_A2]|uniref:hypothetical protein n=1 Tax=Alcaligenes sp. SDU_A2 TaxID=3136634 RepID=UPI00311EFD3F
MKKMLILPALMMFLGAAQAGPVCEFLLSRFAVHAQHEGSLDVQDQPQTCVIRQGQMGTGTGSMVLAFDQLRLSGSGFASGGEEGDLPQTLALDVTGIYVLTGRMPGQDYLMRLQALPMSFGMDYVWDAQSGQLRIERAVLRGERLREISVHVLAQASELAGQPLRLEDLPALRLRHLRLRLDNVALVQSMIMPAVVSSISLYEDPKPTIQAGLLAARTAVMLMPPSTAALASRQALLDFIGELPAPKGQLDLRLDFDPPLDGLALGGAGSMDQVRKAMSGMRVQARYARGDLPFAYVRVRDWLRMVLSAPKNLP